jgi:hypothetical protein
MKKDIHLSTSVDKLELLESLIEDLVNKNQHHSYKKSRVPRQWQTIDTSSVEVYFCGQVEFDYNESQRIRVPYTTPFLFICVKEKSHLYYLNWSFSLN